MAPSRQGLPKCPGRTCTRIADVLSEGALGHPYPLGPVERSDALGISLRALHRGIVNAAHAEGAMSVTFSLDGGSAISGGNDNLVRLWKLPK